MKKREILVDLTSLLDVILIIMFFILVQNTGNMTSYKEKLENDYKETLEKTEEQLSNAKQERDEAKEKLEKLSDSDNEITRLEHELDDLTDWRTVVEDAIYFVSIEMQTDVETRTINITAKPNFNSKIDVKWADDSNIIENEDDVLSELSTTLSSMISSDERPVLIMFNYNRIRNKEFNLIDKGISLFRAERDFNIHYSIYEHDLEQ
jgi:hypothetical protein